MGHEYIYPTRIRTGAGRNGGQTGSGGNNGAPGVSCCDPMGFGDVVWTQYPRFDMASSGVLQIFPANPKRIQLRFLIVFCQMRLVMLTRAMNDRFEPHTFNAPEMLEWLREGLPILMDGDPLSGVNRHFEITPAPTTPISLVAGFNATGIVTIHAFEAQYAQ